MFNSLSVTSFNAEPLQSELSMDNMTAWDCIDELDSKAKYDSDTGKINFHHVEVGLLSQAAAFNFLAGFPADDRGFIEVIDLQLACSSAKTNIDELISSGYQVVEGLKRAL